MATLANINTHLKCVDKFWLLSSDASLSIKVNNINYPPPYIISNETRTLVSNPIEMALVWLNVLKDEPVNVNSKTLTRSLDFSYNLFITYFQTVEKCFSTLNDFGFTHMIRSEFVRDFILLTSHTLLKASYAKLTDVCDIILYDSEACVFSLTYCYYEDDIGVAVDN